MFRLAKSKGQGSVHADHGWELARPWTQRANTSTRLPSHTFPTSEEEETKLPLLPPQMCAEHQLSAGTELGTEHGQWTCRARLNWVSQTGAHTRPAHVSRFS